MKYFGPSDPKVGKARLNLDWSKKGPKGPGELV